MHKYTAKLSLLLLIILEASIYDEGVLSEGVLSGRSLCLDGVMYGGGFVRRGFGPRGFCPRGFCPEGVLSYLRFCTCSVETRQVYEVACFSCSFTFVVVLLSVALGVLCFPAPTPSRIAHPDVLADLVGTRLETSDHLPLSGNKDASFPRRIRDEIRVRTKDCGGQQLGSESAPHKGQACCCLLPPPPLLLLSLILLLLSLVVVVVVVVVVVEIVVAVVLWLLLLFVNCLLLWRWRWRLCC